MSVLCSNCNQPIPDGATFCPACKHPVEIQVIASERGVAAGGDINAPVFTGDIHAPVRLEFTALPDIPPPPEPDRPPVLANFVGRSTELAYYSEKLANEHIAVITGMAGVGKTALAVELLRQVSKDWKIFWHSAHESEGLDALLWELAAFLAWHDRPELWRMLQRTRLSGGQPPPVEVVFNYLLQMLRGGNYLLCFDDFQFIDDDPRLGQFIGDLRASILQGEISMVVTSRRMPAFVQVVQFEPLAGLNLSDVRSLLAARNVELPEQGLEQLYTLTGGNAEFLTLAAEALRPAKEPLQLLERLAQAQDIENYLMAQVDERLSDLQRDVMSAVAVFLGYPVNRAAIEAVLDAGSLLRTLNELSNRYLLTVSKSESGRQYRQHAIVQAFYYQMPGRKHLREMHRRAAEFYETEQPEALKAGMHYERAGEMDKAAEILSADVWALINQGQARLLKDLLARIPPSALAPLLQAQLKIASGHVQALFGEGGNARQSFQSALEVLNGQAEDPQTSILQAQACRGMAELLEFEDQGEALAWVQRGLQYAGDRLPLEQAALLIRAGMIYINLGNLEDSQKSLEQGLERLPQGPSQLRSQALTQLGGLHFFQGDLEQAKACALEALEISRALHDYFQVASILSNLSTYRYTGGDWQGAIADFNQALELAENLSSQKLRVAVEVNLGTAYINTGEADLAQKHLERGLELARENDFPLIEIVALFRLADLHVRSKKWEAAWPLLQDAERLSGEIDATGYLMDVFTLQAEVKLGHGQLEEAQDACLQAIELAENLGEPMNLGIGLRVLGQVRTAMGKMPAALSDFEQSYQLLNGQDPYEAARTQVQWAYALERNSKSSEAKALLEKARATFQALGAKKDLDEVAFVGDWF